SDPHGAPRGCARSRRCGRRRLGGDPPARRQAACRPRLAASGAGTRAGAGEASSPSPPVAAGGGRGCAARRPGDVGVVRRAGGACDDRLCHRRRAGVVSAQALDVQENRASVARATVAQLEAELAQARVNLEYTVLRAPTDGVILAKLKEVGEIAVPGGFAGSGDLVRMANLTDIRAEVDVNEADLNRIHLGQRAQVTPDAYPDARYAAAVVKLYPQVDRQKGTLKVEVHVLEPDARLLPDMSARITFLADPAPAAE